MEHIEKLFNDLHNQNSPQLVEVISKSENVPEHKTTSSTPEEKFSANHYDPIGDHLIKLRRCYFELNCLIEEAEEVKKEGGKLEEKPIKSLKKVSLPNFHENYPFSNQLALSNVDQPKITKKFDVFTKEEVNIIIEIAVKRFLLQAGFFVNNSISNREAIECLTQYTEKFLEMFVNRMKQNQSSTVYSDSKDLWGPLETTIQEMKYDGIPGFQEPSVKSFMEIEWEKNEREIEFGGIAGLHAFFYETVVKTHDKLFAECETMLEKYEKLLSELNVTPECKLQPLCIPFKEE